MAKYTVKEFARALGMKDYSTGLTVISELLQVLEKKGIVRKAGKISTSTSGRGQKSTVYEVPDEITIKVAGTQVVELPEATSVEAPVEAVEAPEVLKVSEDLSEVLEAPEATQEAEEDAVVEEDAVKEFSDAVDAVAADEPLVIAEKVKQEFCYDDDEDEEAA
jgi:hypothetical protein